MSAAAKSITIRIDDDGTATLTVVDAETAGQTYVIDRATVPAARVLAVAMELGPVVLEAVEVRYRTIQDRLSAEVTRREAMLAQLEATQAKLALVDEVVRHFPLEQGPAPRC